MSQKAALQAAVEWARTHKMTLAEIEAQRRSLVRGITARCEYVEVDFEQCDKCREGGGRK